MSEPAGRTLKTARAVLRVLGLLDAAPTGLSASQVAAELGRSRSTATNLLNTLVVEGFAEHDELRAIYRSRSAQRWLEATFTRKAYLARTHDVVGLLLAAGVPRASLATASLGDLPSGIEEVERFLERRSELGLPLALESPLLLDVWGAVVPADEVDDHLRRARTVNVSIEGNAGFCRGLLETRYAAGGTGDDTGRIDPDVVRDRATRLPATTS